MTPIAFLKGFGLGMGVAYFFDPDRGRRRRALLRDQVAAAGRDLQCFVNRASRDLSNRMHGTVAVVQHAFTADTADDRVIAERARAALGHHTSHPRAIHVTARAGCIVLDGQVLRSELDEVLAAISSVRGVKGVENRLEAHESSEPPAHQPHLRGSHRTPASRLVAGATGAGLMANCLLRPSFGTTALGTLGFFLLSRACGNAPVHRLAEIGANVYGTHGSPRAESPRAVH